MRPAPLLPVEQHTSFADTLCPLAVITGCGESRAESMDKASRSTLKKPIPKKQQPAGTDFPQHGNRLLLVLVVDTDGKQAGNGGRLKKEPHHEWRDVPAWQICGREVSWGHTRNFGEPFQVIGTDLQGALLAARTNNLTGGLGATPLSRAIFPGLPLMQVSALLHAQSCTGDRISAGRCRPCKTP